MATNRITRSMDVSMHRLRCNRSEFREVAGIGTPWGGGLHTIAASAGHWQHVPVLMPLDSKD